MATIKFPYADPGIAAFEELDTYVNRHLLAGSHPELKPAFAFPLANSTSFAQFSVVGLNSDGNLALAVRGSVDPEDDIKAIGVIAHACALGATGTGKGNVFYSGCFNIDALVWDASFATDAQKLEAFFGAPTPTNIIAQKKFG